MREFKYMYLYGFGKRWDYEEIREFRTNEYESEFCCISEYGGHPRAGNGSAVRHSVQQHGSAPLYGFKENLIVLFFLHVVGVEGLNGVGL